MQSVKTYIGRRYPNDLERSAVTELYEQYSSWGLKDSKFDTELVSDRPGAFESCLWEMLLARHLKALGFNVSSADAGPDFKLNYNGATIWVEAICPAPTGLPSDWLERCPPGAFRPGSFPHEQMLLRWTAALKEKKEKLTGFWDANQWKRGYVERKIVGANEPYVIAINSSRLSWHPDFSYHGISQKPFALEAALPVGPIQVKIGQETKRIVDRGYQHRPLIKNANSSDVSTESFREPAYAGVSALLGTAMGVPTLMGRKAPIALVHNPLAANKIPAGIFGADDEFRAEGTAAEFVVHTLNSANDARPSTDS
jgi:hypothetical protein